MNSDNLPVMRRVIASTVMFSSDGSILLGRKDPAGGGVYADQWHLIGGGVEPGETLRGAALRELNEEVIGLEVQEEDLEELAWLKGRGETTKTLPNGNKVWCEMEFNYFRCLSSKAAEELSESLKPGSDFVELRFFSRDQLAELPSHPGGVEEKIIFGALTPTSGAPTE